MVVVICLIFALVVFVRLLGFTAELLKIGVPGLGFLDLDGIFAGGELVAGVVFQLPGLPEGQRPGSFQPSP